MGWAHRPVPASSDPMLGFAGQRPPRTPCEYLQPSWPRAKHTHHSQSQPAVRRPTRGGGFWGAGNRDMAPLESQSLRRGQADPAWGLGVALTPQLPAALTLTSLPPGRGGHQRAPRWTRPPGPPGEWLPQTFSTAGSRRSACQDPRIHPPGASHLPPFPFCPHPWPPFPFMMEAVADIQGPQTLGQGGGR